MYFNRLANYNLSITKNQEKHIRKCMAEENRLYDREICLCYHVTFGKLMKHMKFNKIRVASQLSECYGAGTGCGWCVPFLEKIFDQVQKGEDPTPELSEEEYRQRRREYHKTLKKPAGSVEDTLAKLLNESEPKKE